MNWKLSAALLASGVAAVLHAQAPTVGNCAVFPANDIWNMPVDTLPVSPNSANYISRSGPGVGLHPDFGSGSYQGVPLGIPWITVPGTQPMIPVYFNMYGSQSDPGPYAIPLSAPIQGGPSSTDDRHVIAVDTDNCILYELWSAYPGAAGWTAGSGAIYNLKSSALRPDGWTSTNAAGTPNYPGLLRYDEVASGEIRHAINFTLAYTQAAHVWPARHDASSSHDTGLAPMGQRFRLKASVDISTFSSTNQVILRAMKKYGLMLNDNGANWFIAGDNDPRWDNTDLHNLAGITGGMFEAVDVSPLMINSNSGAATQPTASTANTTFTPIHVNAGGPAYTDSKGVAWSADTGYGGAGSTYATSASISNTSDPALYQTSRYGQFTYTFSVPNGSYTVNLKFADPVMGAAGRVFNVAINGAAVLSNFDIAAQAGGARRALDESFPVSVSGGQIAVAFTQGSTNWPTVNGIEVLAGGSAGGSGSSTPGSSTGGSTTGSFTPIRVNAGGNSYSDPNGTVWSADTGFVNGGAYAVSGAVQGTSAQPLYQTSRWGAFSYRFAVPNGSYTVNLKFAEPVMSAANQRVFNVAINGWAALSNFDLVAQAGGKMIALDKSFPVTVASGQIQIDFTAGSQNWPTVNGIEIVAGSGASAPPPASSASALFRVNAGGSGYTDAAGVSWSGDSAFSGGSTYATASSVAGTSSQPLYQTSRYGAFSYIFPVSNGAHTVNLKFAEPVMQWPGQRLFNVAINGSTVLANFDICAQAGGMLRTLDQPFTVNVTGGQITIDFLAGSQNWPTVNAIEIY
ncbi:MAG: malectin [Acidobacteriia bacterium]|nr:malectin [Terriglobia bacterium]